MTQEQKDKINQLNLDELKLAAKDTRKLTNQYRNESYPSPNWRRYYTQFIYIQNRRRELMGYKSRI